MNKNWPRWAFASVSKHFLTLLQPHIKVFIEGQDRNTTGDTDYVEFRMDGPFSKQLSQTTWQVKFEVNILISSIKDLDAHKIHKTVGLVNSAFATNIPIFKLGNGPDDNPLEMFGCLQIMVGPREALMTSHFGQVDNVVVMNQCTVEGHYMALLKNE